MLAIPGNNSLKKGEVNKMLFSALAKERKLPLPAPLILKTSPGKGLTIGPQQRDDMARWLLALTSQFNFSPETYMLSASLLDQFLNLVKARPKYMQCIAISCFFLAAKMKEEDEDVPATDDLVKESGCGCSVAEVLRMERAILDKLKWDINYVTGVDFLQIFHTMLLSQRPWLLDDLPYMTPSRHLTLLTRQLAKCATSHRLSAFRGSTMAASILSLDMEVLTPDWLAVTIVMQQLIGIDSKQLIHCRELIASTLYVQPRELAKKVAMGNPETPISKLLAGSAKRKIIVDEDIVDSIKRLYNEDNVGCEKGDVTPRALKVIPPSRMQCRSENCKAREEGLPTCNPFASLRVS